jgi:hypothetical protein
MLSGWALVISPQGTAQAQNGIVQYEMRDGKEDTSGRRHGREHVNPLAVPREARAKKVRDIELLSNWRMLISHRDRECGSRDVNIKRGELNAS